MAPYFNRIFEDEKGFVYVFLIDPGNRKSQPMDIFDANGKYLYQADLQLSDGYQIESNLAISGNTLCLFVEDDEGEVMLVKYHINNPHK